MKWKSLEHGVTKTKKRFALFPTCLSNNMTVWLEFYDTVYEFNVI